MIFDQLKEVFQTFKPDTHLLAYEELATGHINDTYLVKTADHSLYILQRINQGVFKDVPGLIWNKVHISNHLQQRLIHLSDKARLRRVLTFVNNQNGKPYTVDQEGDYWNLMIYIDQSKTFETVKSAEVAYEGGKLFGEFLNLTSDFDPNKLIEVIPKFHDMDFRYAQFQDSLKKASKERLNGAKRSIDLVAVLKDEMHLLQKLKNTKKIKLRVTHNDTKISNALFDLNNKGLCVIDTDTVMQGIVHYDFGDAIRTICNTAAEDEKDLDQVQFNKPFYQAYLKGFLEKTEATLTPVEIKYLALGAKTMIFIMALRFLTDYLNGDIYYKTKYDDHNLDRAKNQFKLIQSFDEKMGKVS
jgi:thiamine kinase-like enzyme